MKRRIVYLFILMLVVFFVSVLIYRYNQRKILFDNKNIYEFNVSYDVMQKDVDKEISKYIKNKNITFDSPKVLLNPYGVSPLSALVVFYTDKNTGIKLYVNDVFMTTIESSKSHVIPVYGLREDYKNKITLLDDNNKEKILYIKTDKVNEDFNYEYETMNNTDEHLFINSYKGKYALDNDGYISWYMDIDNLEMDVTLDKEIYFVDKYSRIIKTDYMGRVYQVYYIDSSYNSHGMKKLNNGNFMLIDMDGSISIIDYKTGKVIYSIDLEEIFRSVDNEFVGDSSEFYANYFQYNEEDNTILISVRGLDAVVNYDLTDNEVIWLFSENNIFSSLFDKYKLKLTSGNYFIGQHTPYLDGNHMYVFDNNNFMMHNGDISNLKDSSAVIYEIDGMKIKEVYRYNSEYSSSWYGSFFEKDDIKNINFGCVLTEDNKSYSKIIELDQEDNVITDFTTDFTTDFWVYQSFRDSFYNEITTNYQVNVEVNMIMENEDKYFNLNEYDVDNKFRDNIKNAIVDETMIDISVEGIKSNIIEEDFEILFVNGKGRYYKYEVNEDVARNIWYLYINRFVSYLNGEYAVYIKINDKYYNTNLVFDIN